MSWNNNTLPLASRTCALALHVYKPQTKDEVRLVYRLQSLDATLRGKKEERHQKSYSSKRFGLAGAWQKAKEALLYINATGQLPLHFSCRANRCVEPYGRSCLLFPELPVPCVEAKHLFYIPLALGQISVCAEGMVSSDQRHVFMLTTGMPVQFPHEVLPRPPPQPSHIITSAHAPQPPLIRQEMYYHCNKSMHW